MKQMFFCNYIAFSIVTDADNLISGSSVFSKANLYILKFSIHIMLKPCLKDFEHYLASMWNECKCMVFGHSSFGLKWNWSFLDALCQIFLLGNLYAGQEATVRTRHGTTDWFQIRKGVRQGCILSPCLFNLYAECIMRNTGLDEAQAGIKISGKNINNLR